MASINQPKRPDPWLGALFRGVGDWFYHRKLDRAADVLYAVARKLGANMEWPGK